MLWSKISRWFRISQTFKELCIKCFWLSPSVPVPTATRLPFVSGYFLLYFFCLLCWLMLYCFVLLFNLTTVVIQKFVWLTCLWSLHQLYWCYAWCLWTVAFVRLFSMVFLILRYFWFDFHFNGLFWLISFVMCLCS